MNARNQLTEIVEDIIDTEGTWHKGRDPLDLLNLVQLFKMQDFRVFFLQLLLERVPQPVSEVSMELLADLCRVVLREANNCSDMESVLAVYCIGNSFYVERGGVRSSMLLNLRNHEAWGMARFWDHVFARLVAFEENTCDVLGGAAKALFGITPTLLRECLLLLRFASLTRDVVFFDLLPEVGAQVAQALTTVAKQEIPRLREAFPEAEAGFICDHSRFRTWTDVTMLLARHPGVTKQTAGLMDLLVCLSEGPFQRRVDLAGFQALAPDGGIDLTSRFACGHSTLRDLFVGVLVAAAAKDGQSLVQKRTAGGNVLRCSLSGLPYKKWDMLGALGSRALRKKLPEFVSEVMYRDLVMPPRDSEPRLYRVGYGVGAAICYPYSFGHIPDVRLIMSAAYEVLSLKGSAATAIQAAYRGYRLRASQEVRKWRSQREKEGGKWGHERWQTMDDDLIEGMVNSVNAEDAAAAALAQEEEKEAGRRSDASSKMLRSRTAPAQQLSDPRTAPLLSPESATSVASSSRSERIAQRQKEFEVFVTRLRGGIDVKKHGRRGRPHIRTVFLHGELGGDAKLCWVAPGRAELKPNPKSSVDLSQVKSVKVGKDGSRFEGLVSLDCTSRMLILEPPTDEAKQQLVRGFVQLVDHIQTSLRR